MSTTTDPSMRGRRASADDELAFAGLSRLAELLHHGHITPRELTEFYLRRIEALNPRLGAFASIRAEEALAEADAALERLRAGERGSLLGIPVAIKDNVDIAGEITAHGTAAHATPATADSEVIRRLRAAGAPIVGRTSLPELAIWGHMTESQTYGVTRNPWNPDLTAGGSSGGTAAAVATGMVPIGLGSDGGGSIRIPAALCGLFGLKPTRGRISTLPDAEHWYGMTVYGGLGRSVLDVALFDDALRGPAPGDVQVLPGPPCTFAEAARREPERLRVAVSLKGTLPGIRPSATARRAVQNTAELLDSLGHAVAEQDPNYGVLFGDIMPRYLSGIAQDAAKLDHPERLERRSQAMAAMGRRLQRRALRRALGREERVTTRVGSIFADHDVLLTPVTAAPPEPVERWHGKGALRTFLGGGPYVTYTTVWNLLGVPAAAVPAGLDDQRLPTAVQIVAPPGAETTLLSLAAQLEAARPWAQQRPPINRTF
jgi:amidase